MGRHGRRRVSITSMSITRMRPTWTFSAGARSSSGSARLGPGPARRRWPPGCSHRRRRRRSDERHAAIDELRPRLDLREDLELLGAEVRAGIDPAALAAWCARPARVSRPVVAVIAAVLAVLARPPWSAGCSSSSSSPLADHPDDRGDLRSCLSRGGCATSWPTSTSERTTWSSSRSCCAGWSASRSRRRSCDGCARSLETEGLPASARIRRLARLLHLLDYQRNQFFMPLAAIWLWTTQLAIRIDAWRRDRRAGGSRHWLDAIGDFEALCALAAYAAENPADPFPELVEARLLKPRPWAIR